MLLSEPGEIFFEDYSVQMRRPDASSEEDKKWIDGRLKLCSKSLVFVNKDINQPLIKIQFKETISIEQYTSTNEVGYVHINIFKFNKTSSSHAIVLIWIFLYIDIHYYLIYSCI